jgi:hypothetical protein
MLPTLATMISNSLTGLSWLSPVEVVAALAALAYGVGGLVALRLAGRTPAAAPEPRDRRRVPYDAAALSYVGSDPRR